MKRTIAIIAGGDSAEHDVSMRSAQGILSFIDHERYNCYIVEITGTKWLAQLHDGSQSVVDRNDFSFKTPQGYVRPQFAYITIHGTPGENGLLQGYFELIRMPYSTSNPLVEALTFNKFSLNQYLKAWGIRIADSILIRKKTADNVTDEEILNHIGLPCFVKPAANGSSFGVSKVKTAADLRPAIHKAFLQGEEVMVEEFLQGTEVTCGCYKTKQASHVLPVTEVVSADEFFDYDAKYNGFVKEITPARINNNTTQRIQQLTSTIYDILGCEGIIRIDYILTGEDASTINLLEINTTPGMTTTSFIPQQVKAAGLEMKQVITDIIENKFNTL